MKLAADPFATYKLLEAELSTRGYTMSTEYEGRRMIATFTSPAGKVWQTYAGRIRYPSTTTQARDLFDDKAEAYTFLQSEGIPIPFTLRFAKDEVLSSEYLASILQLHTPLIVKPNNASLSRGLTLNITSTDMLHDAIAKARAVKEEDILIQQQVVGEEVRFIIIKGKVVAALLRQTPRVVGDGVRSIKELIEIENEARQKLVFTYLQYPQLTNDIIDEALMQSTRVPSEGEVVELSNATMIKNGCSVYEVLDQVHPSYIKEIETFAKDIDADFFVSDFLLHDYTKEGGSDNHWFLEFNTSPVLKLCYGCRDGKMFDVIPLVADLIDESIN